VVFIGFLFYHFPFYRFPFLPFPNLPLPNLPFPLLPFTIISITCSGIARNFQWRSWKMRRLDRALKLLESREDRVWWKGIPTGGEVWEGAVPSLQIFFKFFTSKWWVSCILGGIMLYTHNVTFCLLKLKSYCCLCTRRDREREERQNRNTAVETEVDWFLLLSWLPLISFLPSTYH